MKILQKTQSLCPICFRSLKAYYAQRKDGVFFEKSCPEHGDFSIPAWLHAPNTPTFEQWCSAESFTRTISCNTLPSAATAYTSTSKGCPHDCGICSDHIRQSCCVLFEITQRCNMQCPICYASATMSTTEQDVSLCEIKSRLQELMQKAGPVNIQLSGGEPTMRDDLESIITLTHDEGFPFVQLNTNGLRLGQDPSYAAKLKKAGLNLVYLQWDSMEDAAYTKLRGGAYTAIKEKALQHCIEAELPVLLVVTLVRNVNDTHLGTILMKALTSGPAVRGIHVQPVASFGRYPWEHTAAPRLTIPEVLHALETQSQGMLKATHFHPPNSEHPLCSFSAVYQRHEHCADTTTLQPVHEQNTCCASTSNTIQKLPTNISPAVQAREFVAHHWGADVQTQTCAHSESKDDLDNFLQKNTLKNRFTVSGMLFQDAYSLDLARLRRCHIHLAVQGSKIIPFCSYNMTSSLGFALHRGK